MKKIIRIRSITEVHKLYGYDMPKHPLVSVLPIDERMTGFDYGDASYVLDFYQISLKEGLKGTMGYGRNTYDFHEGTMTFIKPGQVVKVKNNTVPREGGGWTLLFHPDLIRRSELGKTIEHYSFFDYEANEALHLSVDEKNALTELTQKTKQEYSQNLDKHSQDIIVANLDLILKYCKRYYDRQFYTRTNLNKDLLSKFEAVVRDYYRSDKPFEHGVLSVKHCAGLLQMSSNYLGDLIKMETGRTAKDHIQDYVIDLAKTKIVGSTQSISEIAYSLGFEYPQGFNKLFKAKTGLNPSQYRNAN